MQHRWTLILPLALMLGLAACSTGAGAPTASPDATPAATTDLQASCAAQGGVVRALGRLQREQCVVPYGDAGRACSSRSDCAGQCLATAPVPAGTAARGVCQRDASEHFGCRQRIEGGVAQGTICVD
ncbi:hypothetical protein [Xanthomonas sp. XNM01]|uniref:hypothetical protein n=1 Tax=Xanthomonas sp. XNM01 TaxID=2769289 RepID=UPI001780FEA2|nr:hypothetical protein [Xanthomonas sp. XNM01]MBD9370358.1 hypothetical protein [Xanthomonas sp. XNM01]